MKSLVAVCVFVFVFAQVNAQTDKQKELLAKHHKECLAKSQVSQITLDKARTGDFQNDPKLAEHILCISKKIGFQNEVGELQREVIERKLKEAVKGDETKTKKLITDCVINDANPKTTAVNAFKCIYQKANINLL
uniref:Odorant binding protein n=3 Tax=Neoptera TaxID=33340 RepID=A0A6B7M926_CYLFO|nr:odorant binding protein [Cylas formicarius]